MGYRVKLLYVSSLDVSDRNKQSHLPEGPYIIYNDLERLGIYVDIDDIRNCSDSHFSINYDIIAISHLLCGDINDFYRACDIIKKYNIPIIIGGFNVDPDFIKQIVVPLGIEYAFIGEGDKIVAQIIKDIIDHKDLSKYQSSLYIRGKTDDINALEYHTVPLEDIMPLNIPDDVVRRYNCATIEVSRGCPKIPKCSFCAYSDNFRTRSLNDVLVDTNHVLSRNKTMDVILANSNFNQDIIFEVLLRYPKTKFFVIIECGEFENYKNFILEHNVRNIELYIGVESFVQEKLDLMKKNRSTTAEMRFDIVKECEKYDINCAINLLVELPGETEEMTARDLKIMKSSEFFKKHIMVSPVRRLFYSSYRNNTEIPNFVDTWLEFGEYQSPEHRKKYDNLAKDN
jgi:radical SAM superfamily enzyme YgiQ (UPF0313 family)